MNEEYCNQCENHCSKEQLRCGRGRRYFGIESDPHGGIGDHEELPGTLQALMTCGHFLHHGKAEDGSKLLSVLTDEEQTELERLLRKLLEDWQARFPMGEHSHGHRDKGAGHHKNI